MKNLPYITFLRSIPKKTSVSQFDAGHFYLNTRILKNNQKTTRHRTNTHGKSGWPEESEFLAINKHHSETDFQKQNKRKTFPENISQKIKECFKEASFKNQIYWFLSK